MSRPTTVPGLLDIRVLGPLEVRVDGIALRVDTRKALAIVALLAVEGRPFARDELAAMFWPESDDESARGALRRTLSVLRSALGDRWLRVDRSAVALDAADGVQVDLALLEAAAGEGGSDVGRLAAAAGLARGPFLAGFSLRDSPDFDDWCATRAVSIERRVVDVLERLSAAAEAGGDTETAVAAAMRLVERDPLDEPARRRLMSVLAACGDRAGAIRQYRATVAVLERELGVSPLAETTALYEAIRDVRFETAAPAAPARRVVPVHPDALARLPMLGRDDDLARLIEVHASATPGGRLVCVTGEAGIGKSRLAETACASVEARGSAVLAARAFPAEGSISYAPIVGLLRAGFAREDAVMRLASLPGTILDDIERLVSLPDSLPARPPALRRVGDGPGARARLLDAIAETVTSLVSGPVPGVVVVEDLQWADDASREALLYLARRLHGRPLLLLVTWRREDLDAQGQAFRAAVEGVAGATLIQLDRLDQATVHALVASAAGAGLPPWDPEALVAESEGLPLYLAEALVAGPGEPGAAPPSGVRALLAERLASVGETATQVLSAAAVIGRSFNLDLVRVAGGRSEDETVVALEELVRRAIIREVATGGVAGFDFSHARLRDAAYEEIGLARRRLLHRRVAEGLRAHAAGREDAGQLALVAGHELAAGRDTVAAEGYRVAGLRARDVYANREALGHLATALALGHPDIAGLQISIGELRTVLGDYAGAIAALETAASVVADDRLPEIELRLGRAHARRGDVATAASHLDAALAGLDAAGGSSGGAGKDPRLRATLLVERGAVALRASDLDLAGSLADEALAAATAADDARGTGAASRLAGLVALRRGDFPEARGSLEVSLAAAAGDPDPGAAIAARNALALVEAAAGDRSAAIRLLEEALAECRRTGETHLEAAVENNLADQLHAAGRADEAMVHLKRAVALFAEVGGQPGELQPEIWKLVAW